MTGLDSKDAMALTERIASHCQNARERKLRRKIYQLQALPVIHLVYTFVIYQIVSPSKIHIHAPPVSRLGQKQPYTKLCILFFHFIARFEGKMYKPLSRFFF